MRRSTAGILGALPFALLLGLAGTGCSAPSPDGDRSGDTTSPTAPGDDRPASSSPEAARGEVRVYVADRYESVRQLAPDTLETIATVDVGLRPHGLLLTPEERELWVAAYATDTVHAFSVPQLERFAEIPVPGGPHWFALHPDGEPLYVTLESTGKVAAIHRGLREVIRVADVGRGPTRIIAFRTPVESPR